MADDNSLIDLTKHFPITIQRVNNPDERYQGLLVGQISPDHILLCDIQAENFTIGERVIIRTIRGGRIWGFETFIIDMNERPVPIVFLAPPKDVETVSLRKTDRLNVFIPADLRTHVSDEGSSNTLLIKATILNLGSGGCRVFTKTRIPSDSSINISFLLPGDKNVILISGTVLDTYQNKSIFGQRIKFFNVETYKEDMANVRKWLKQHSEFTEA